MNKLDQSLDQIIGSGKAVRKGRGNARRAPYKRNGGGFGGGGGRGSAFGVPVFLAHSNLAQKIRNQAGEGCIVYVGNLPWAAKWQELKDLCAEYGDVGRADVEETPEGKSAGYGTVVFENRKDANKCVNGLNGAEYEGRVLEVRLDNRAAGSYDKRGSDHVGYSGGGGGGGGGGRGSAFGVPLFLANSNLAQKIRNQAGQGCIVYVGNLPWSAEWQELKDICKEYGDVGRADVEETPEGKSAGYGTVVFENRADANRCVNGLNGAEYEGRVLEVRLDNRAVGTYDKRGAGIIRKAGRGAGRGAGVRKGRGGGKSQPFEEGDWICPDCGDHQFARNTECRMCGASRP